MKLGVNVDHVATVRQARRTYEPDPVAAAMLATLGGADVITIHLREDRRHIQDRDLRLMRETVYTKLNLEMAAAPEIVRIALETKPEQVTLVPEKRQEITTEGGLDVAGQKESLKPVVESFREAGITVSMFVDPDEGQLKASKDMGAEFVELHTGTYANARSPRDVARALEQLIGGAQICREIGIGVNAGHGLNYVNVGPIIEEIVPKELHIGHSIIARAIFVGIKQAVRDMKNLIDLHAPRRHNNE